MFSADAPTLDLLVVGIQELVELDAWGSVSGKKDLERATFWELSVLEALYFRFN